MRLNLIIICLTVIIVAILKYFSPLIEKDMEIDLAKWLVAPKILRGLSNPNPNL